MTDSFQTTQWSVVLTAGLEAGEAQRAALSALCMTYWYPLYAYVRRKGYSEPDAQDLTQGFFVQILSRKGLESADPERGRFRSFLLVALKNYIINVHRRDSADKRGGGQVLLSLDEMNGESRYQREPTTGETPETLYHRNFANAVVSKAMDELADEYRLAGKERIFSELSLSMTTGRTATDTQGHAVVLGISRNAVSAALHRMRKRFGEILRQHVAGLVNSEDEAEVESEMQALLNALYP